MPSISSFYGLSVYMYNNGKEHNPPHFHVYYGDKECVINIHECILAWCEIHKDELLQNWELAMKEKKLKKISPLR